MNTIKPCASALLAALLALALAPAHAIDQPSMVVVRDAVTGQLRAATAAEMRALSDPNTAITTTKPRLTATRRANGSSTIHLGDRAMVYSVLTRDADGHTAMQCVQGAAAADAATAKPQATTSEEPRHEDR